MSPTYDKEKHKLATDKWRAKNADKWREICRDREYKVYHIKIYFDYERQAKILRKCLL